MSGAWFGGKLDFDDRGFAVALVAVRVVEVGGNDVGLAMIDAGVAHDYGNSDGWCSE